MAIILFMVETVGSLTFAILFGGGIYGCES